MRLQFPEVVRLACRIDICYHVHSGSETVSCKSHPSPRRAEGSSVRGFDPDRLWPMANEIVSWTWSAAGLVVSQERWTYTVSRLSKSRSRSRSLSRSRPRLKSLPRSRPRSLSRPLSRSQSRSRSLPQSLRGDRTRSCLSSRGGDDLLDGLRRSGDLLAGDRVRSLLRGLSRPRDPPRR